MRALEEPLPRAKPGFFHGTPVWALVVLAGTWGLAVVTLSDTAARVLGLAAAHGALLGTALAWTGARRRDRWAPLEAALVLAVAAAVARLHPLGAAAYVSVPVWLAWRRGPDVTGIAGFTIPAAAGGALFGALLGGHLLVNTSLTFGYRIRTGPLAELTDW